jgi:hypothetical protein
MIKRLTAYLLSVAAVLVLFSSCDYVDPPYTETANGNPNTSDTVFRKILIEDYTGFRCGNCPAAAQTIYNTLHPLYGEELISIGVHASPSSTFTNTTPPASLPSGAPSGSFSTDFRTPAGEAWLAFFNVSANPNGMVSRLDYPTNGHVKLPGAWATAAQSIYHQPAKFKIEITNQYDSTSGNLDCDVKVKVLQAVSGNYNLSVVLTEDSIINWQVWYSHTPQNEPNYMHRHVLRGSINGTFGDQVFTGSAAVDDSTSNTYSVNLNNITPINPVNPVLNIDHCHIVAFVFDNTTKEIWQVEEEKVR